MNWKTHTAIQRPVYWPIAAVAAVGAFFVSYVAIALVLDALFLPPNPETIQLMADGPPMPKQSMMHAAFSMLLALGVGQAAYTALRGESVAEALGKSLAKFVRVTVAYVTWVAGLFGILWLLSQGGAPRPIGTILLIAFGLVSLAIFAKIWERNTPPYHDSPE